MALAGRQVQRIAVVFRTRRIGETNCDRGRIAEPETSQILLAFDKLRPSAPAAVTGWLGDTAEKARLLSAGTLGLDHAFPRQTAVNFRHWTAPGALGKMSDAPARLALFAGGATSGAIPRQYALTTDCLPRRSRRLATHLRREARCPAIRWYYRAAKGTPIVSLPKSAPKIGRR